LASAASEGSLNLEMVLVAGECEIRKICETGEMPVVVLDLRIEPQEEYLNLRLPAELRVLTLLSYFFPSKL
jgi:hypothetical protein